MAKKRQSRSVHPQAVPVDGSGLFKGAQLGDGGVLSTVTTEQTGFVCLSSHFPSVTSQDYGPVPVYCSPRVWSVIEKYMDPTVAVVDLCWMSRAAGSPIDAARRSFQLAFGGRQSVTGDAHTTLLRVLANDDERETVTFIYPEEY